MNNADRKELQRRFRKDNCTITRLCGCYVDSEKNIITHFEETFLNLEDSKFYKYLDIAKAVLSGKLGDNLLELKFNEERVSGRKLLEEARDSKLKNVINEDDIFDGIIENYDHLGNYLILLFHDAYDIITYTKNREKLDESEDVYEYLLCAICPVSLTMPGLGYDETENRIKSRVRDWVVGKPDIGFLWPAFTDRKEDRDTVAYYTRDSKHTHKEFMKGFLGCEDKLTHTEHREKLRDIINSVFGEDSNYYESINELIAEMAEHPAMDSDGEHYAAIDAAVMRELLEETDASDREIKKVLEDYKEQIEKHGAQNCNVLADLKLAEKNRKEISQKEQNAKVNRMKEILKKAFNQLINPDEKKEEVCSSITKLLEEEV